MESKHNQARKALTTDCCWQASFNHTVLLICRNSCLLVSLYILRLQTNFVMFGPEVLPTFLVSMLLFCILCVRVHGKIC